jgi:uncharacterized membrane protein YvbJ
MALIGLFVAVFLLGSLYVCYRKKKSSDTAVDIFQLPSRATEESQAETKTVEWKEETEVNSLKRKKIVWSSLATAGVPLRVRN